MHHYPHHIGDFIRETSRLSNDLTMCYLRMIWLYLETEKPLTSNENAIALRIGHSASDVDLISDAFFIRNIDGTLTNDRCEQIISAFRKKSDSARNANQKRWASEAHLKSDTNQIATNNQEPRTNNQEPEEKRAKRSVIQKPDSVDQQIWQDFLTLRKAKKAPLSITAITRIEKEAQKAGIGLEKALEIMCSRGWIGFDASWQKTDVQNKTTFAERDAEIKRNRVAQWASGVAAKPASDSFVIEAEAFNVPSIASY